MKKIPLLAPTKQDIRNMRHCHHSKTMGGFVGYTEKESNVARNVVDNNNKQISEQKKMIPLIASPVGKKFT